MRGGLRARTYLASGVLALIVGGAFVFLFLAITNLREATDLRRRAREAQVAANGLETLVIDLETGLRGFVITGEVRFLQPWNHARTAFPEQAATLERLVADDSVRLSQVQRIVQAGTSYIEEYSVPLVDAASRLGSRLLCCEATANGAGHCACLERASPPKVNDLKSAKSVSSRSGCA